MTRRRRVNNGLPWRVYERFGIRRWRLFLQPPSGPRVSLVECHAGAMTKAEARAKARLAYQRLYGSTPEALAEALTFKKLAEQYFEWQESLPADDDGRKADSVIGNPILPSRRNRIFPTHH